MGLRAFTISTTAPVRASFWKLLNEAWGYFNGGIHITSGLHTTPRIREEQVLYHPSGHYHSLVGDFLVGGVCRRNIDSSCRVCWWDLDVPSSFSAPTVEDLALLAGHGSVTLTLVGTVSTYTQFAYGSTLIDYNPGTSWATTQVRLDMRVTTCSATYDTSYGTQWTILGAWATPQLPSLSASGDGGANWVFFVKWGSISSVPYFVFHASTTAVVTTALQFDYLVAVKKGTLV